MRALVLGGSGMLGHQLLRILGERMEAFGTFRDAAAAARCRAILPRLAASKVVIGVDAFEIDTVRRAIDTIRPDVVLNCIGIVKQSDAASEAVPSIRLNALFPHELAGLCAPCGARLVQFSTDCVFSGRRGHYGEDDIPDPVDLYGRSKLLGEVVHERCLTIRTSIVGWELEHRRSLLSWFAGQRGARIHGYTRAIFTGLPTSELAKLVAQLVETTPGLSGLYHVASAPISKYALLCALRDALGWHIEIDPDSGFACDRSLDGRRLGQATGWTAPAWPSMIAQLAAERPIYESGGMA